MECNMTRHRLPFQLSAYIYVTFARVRLNEICFNFVYFSILENNLRIILPILIYIRKLGLFSSFLLLENFASRN
jgi:hypothetical protein